MVQQKAARKSATKPAKKPTKKPANKPVKKPAKKPASKKPAAAKAAATGSPSQRIDARIAELGDWRGEMLGRIRTLIKQAVPDVVEEWKWMGTPVWERDGIICTGETYKA